MPAFGTANNAASDRYQDTVESFSIPVLTHQGKRSPLYLSGQYRRREFLLSWYIELQSLLLHRLGLLTDVEAQSRAAMELLRSRLGNPGSCSTGMQRRQCGSKAAELTACLRSGA